MTAISRLSFAMLFAPCTALLCLLGLLSSTPASAQTVSFTQLTAHAPWDVRSEAALAFHAAPLSYYPPASATAAQSSADSLILFGGRGVGSQYDNDVWLYDGAASWTLIAGTNRNTSAAASSASGPVQYTMHAGSALCAGASGDALYVIAGHTGPTYYDVSTSGGVSWADNQTAALPWSARSFATCVVDPQSGVAYLMGGLDYSGYTRGDDPAYNDVYAYSPATQAWALVTDAAAWPPRNALSSAAAYSATLGTTLLYVAGGLTNAESGYGFFDPTDLGSADVWVSSNGGHAWSELSPAAFPVRELARLAVSPSGVLVMAEGAANVSSYPHDIWASADGGVTWGQCSAPASAAYPPRRNFAMAFDGAGYLWLMGGECYGAQCTATSAQTYEGKYNDVWRSGISFDDLSAVSAACGIAVSPCGAGARCWPITGPCPCTAPSSSAAPASASSSTSAPVSPSASSSTGVAATSQPSAASSSTGSPVVAPPTPSSSSGSPVGAASSSAAVMPATSAPASSSASPAPSASSTAAAASSSSTGAAVVINPTAAASSSSSSSSGAVAPPITSSSSSGGGGGLSTGAIIGIVVGVIVALLILCLLWFMYTRCRKEKRDDSPYPSARASARPRPADETDSSESGVGEVFSSGRGGGGGTRPMHEAVQIWGTGELELNGSKQLAPSHTSSHLRSSSISSSGLGGTSSINSTADSLQGVPSYSAVYVHD